MLVNHSFGGIFSKQSSDQYFVRGCNNLILFHLNLPKTALFIYNVLGNIVERVQAILIFEKQLDLINSVYTFVYFCLQLQFFLRFY